MATNVTVYDLDNYPDNSKTVSIDLKTVIPVGEEGDEQWVIQFYTSAYSDNVARTAISDLYVTDIKAGWTKSSGLVGVGGKFTLTTSAKILGIKMDNSTNTYYITLTTGTNLTSASIAADIETQIRVVPDQALFTDTEYTSAYRNASVDVANGRFRIVSGSMSSYYTGSERSSAYVTYSGSDTCFQTLGFDLGLDSQTIAGLSIKEVLVSSSYTADSTPLSIGAGTGVQEGNALYITDGNNEDYFTALSGTTDTSVVVATSGTNNHGGITHSYTSGEAKVQLLVPGDPDMVPLPYYTDVDGVVRWVLSV